MCHLIRVVVTGSFVPFVQQHTLTNLTLSFTLHRLLMKVVKACYRMINPESSENKSSSLQNLFNRTLSSALGLQKLFLQIFRTCSTKLCLQNLQNLGHKSNSLEAPQRLLDKSRLEVLVLTCGTNTSVSCFNNVKTFLSN